MIRFYADECAHGLVIRALRERGVDVLTAQADDRVGHPDAAVLDRATELGRVLFSQDDDLLREAVRRQRLGVPFAGVVFAHQQGLSIAICIEDLVLLAEAGEPHDLANRVEYLPL